MTIAVSKGPHSLGAKNAPMRFQCITEGEGGTLLRMKKPTKKEIRERIEKLKDTAPGRPAYDMGPTGKPEPKKPNKSRIRKKGV